mmetsp:Transcript_8615/g.23634  ORF Transcript_8615/g.23634 Transcript_8615/m.23634 type:complete len:218 (+) Transcript_8615:592-1245(+)
MDASSASRMRIGTRATSWPSRAWSSPRLRPHPSIPTTPSARRRRSRCSARNATSARVRSRMTSRVTARPSLALLPRRLSRTACASSCKMIARCCASFSSGTTGPRSTASCGPSSSTTTSRTIPPRCWRCAAPTLGETPSRPLSRRASSPRTWPPSSSPMRLPRTLRNSSTARAAWTRPPCTTSRTRTSRSVRKSSSTTGPSSSMAATSSRAPGTRRI